MALESGTRLGPYRLEGVLGAGGMGEVYRARDVRLDRTVAIKILPAGIASDQESRQRFEREAKAIAALSHPHICTLYDVGEEADTSTAARVQFLVMEYLEGETLADVLRAKRLPLDQVLRVGIQCADALDRAHRTGIVHRDLKPGNIMLTARGAVLLDFGLARTLRPGPISTMNLDATVTSPLTSQGAILGTLHYMSPEQVEGKDADTRSDIFSLGTILYEMTMGRRAFEGHSAAGVMAAILEREPPPMSAREPPAPPLLEHIVSRCLAKDPHERWQSAGDVMRELSWFAQTGDRTTEPVHAKSPSRWPERFAWMLALVSAAAIAAVVAMMFFARSPSQEMRPDIATPPTNDPFSLAISPDGQKVIFAAAVEGVPRLWLRRLDTESQQPLRDTDGGYLPFWSPDSRSIGFAASGQLKRLDLETGSVRKLANAPLFLGGTWSREGHILFVPTTSSRVYRIAADSPGTPTVVTPFISQSLQQSAPYLLPGTDRFLFYVTSSPDATHVRGIYVSNADGTGVQRLLDADSPAVYAPSGHLLFQLKDHLFARPFDASRAHVTGEAMQVAGGLMHRTYAGSLIVALSAAETGRIVYRTGTPEPDRFQVGWFDRSGTAVPPVTDRLQVALNPALSPDGHRAALFTGQADIYLLDLLSKRLEQFTFDKALDFGAVWSPDGSQLIFSSTRKGQHDLYQKHASGAGGDKLLLESSENKVPTDWSADAKFLIYRNMDANHNFDIRGLSLADKREFTVLATEHDERDAQLSSDGKWIAYQSNESGRFEVYVRPFRPPGADVKADERWKVSSNGGTQVRWKHDRTELFYVGLDGRLMAVPIRQTADATAIVAGTPQGVNAPTIPLLFGGGTQTGSYAVTRDGRRFLTTTLPSPAVTTPVTLLLNWPPAQ